MNRVRLSFENRIVGISNAKPEDAVESNAQPFEKAEQLNRMAAGSLISRFALLSLFALIVTLLGASTGAAAIVTTAGSGNWNSTTPNAPWPGGTVPAAADDVVIRPGDNITVTANATINSIAFDSTAATATDFTVNAGIIMTVTAGVTLRNAVANNVNFTIQGAGTLNCDTLTLGTTITNPSNDLNTTLTSTISTLGITGNLTVRSEDNGAFQGDARFVLTSGTVTVGGSVVLDADSDGAPLPVSEIDLNGGGVESGTVVLPGATPFSTPGGGTVVTDFIGNAATINYSGAAQTVRADLYTNLILSGSGSKTTTGVTVNNTLSMQGTATASALITYAANATLEYKGSAAQTASTNEFPAAMTADVIIDNPSGVTIAATARTLDGNLTLTTGTFATGNLLSMGVTPTALITRGGGDMTGTIQGANHYDVTYIGSSKISGPELSSPSFNDLNVMLTAGQTLTLSAAIDLIADLTIGVGSTLDVSLSNFAINVGDEWDNSGTFIPRNGTVTFDGVAEQVINANQTFNNVVVNKSAGAVTPTTSLTVNDLTLTLGNFSPPATLNINGNLIHTAGTWTTGANTNIKGNWTKNGGTFTAPGGDTVTFNGSSAQAIGGSDSTAFSGLTINNAAGVNMNTSGSVSGVLTLTTDLTVVSPAVLTTTGSTSAAAAQGDVIGSVTRTDVSETTTSFGNVNVQVTRGTGGSFTTMTVKLTKSAPPSHASAVTRLYVLTPGAGTIGTSPVLRLRYRDSELNGNTEATLQLWRLDGTTWTAQGGTADTANNHVTATVNGFSSWAIAGPNAPTDVAMVDLKATRYNNRVLLEWQTGYEVSNLGFHVYRGQKGNFTKITADPIAGSALIFGPRVALRAGFAYSWWDNDAPAGDDTTYWVEDLDISGRTSIKGPFHITPSAPGDKSAASAEVAPTLGAIGSNASKLGSSAPVERRAAAIKLTPATLAVQAVTAAQQAVKLSVKHEGWYRVEKSALVAAGFPSIADAQKLQLIVDGQEVPIQVTSPSSSPTKGGKPVAAAWDGIEFYGIGIDSSFTDSHVYWLVAGSQNGLRIGQAADQGGAPAPASFPHSVERRDKVLYFAAVKNGGAEKFFGPPIFNAVPVDQSVVLKNVAPAGDATVDVSLQGLTDVFHSVRVLLNGTELGTVQFNGLAKGSAQYSVPQTSLLEATNQIQFISPPGFNDITLVEFVRVTYEHTNKADDNSLRFPATGSQLATIGGFTSDAIRVVDVTVPASPQEVAVTVAPDGSEFAASFTVPGAGARTLLAFASDQKKSPASLVANLPSSWRTSRNGATYIAVTRKDLISSLDPLVTHRRNQGHKTALLDIQDVYDEFSFGHKSPQALKDFFAYAKSNWKIAPKFALLGGDATYDPKNYTGTGDFDIIPTRLVETNFSETGTDDWFVDLNGDSVPEVAIGRLPVRSPQQTASMVAKIVRYDRSEPVRRVLMVADRNDGFDFEAADSQSQALIPATLSITGIRRGLLGDSLTRTRLLEALNIGAKFVNFYGHGSTRLWTDAQILSAADAASLANTDRLALFDSMTCLTGFFHDVSIESLGEALLKSPGGAIAVWASSGMTDPASQVLMNQEAIRLLFSGAGLTIGEVTMRAKAATGNADVRRTWILLGDPATKLR